jgi:uncharacterized membrane protein
MNDSSSASPSGEGAQQRLADIVTAFCGDMRFVYIHVVVFAVWIATRGFGSDEFPFNFLTMAVSLEAIFLSTFILISQNRQEAANAARNEQIQQSLLRMVSEVIDDEKLDQMNEEMIQALLRRIDVDHLRPMREQIAQIAGCVTRIEKAMRG